MASNDDFELKESNINNYWAQFIVDQSKRPPKEDEKKYHFCTDVNKTSEPTYDDSTKLDVADIQLFRFAPYLEPLCLVMCYQCRKVTQLQNMEAHVEELHKCSLKEYSLAISSSQCDSAYGSEKSDSCPSNGTLPGRCSNKARKGGRQQFNCTSFPASGFTAALPMFTPESKSLPSRPVSQQAFFLVQPSTVPCPPVKSNNSLVNCTNTTVGTNSLNTYSKRQTKNSTGSRGRRGRNNNTLPNNCALEESVHLPINKHVTFSVETARTTVPLISETYSKRRKGSQKNSAPPACRGKKRKCNEVDSVQDNVLLSINEKQMPDSELFTSVPTTPLVNNSETFSKGRRGSYKNASSFRGRRLTGGGVAPVKVLTSVPETSVHLINSSEHLTDSAKLAASMSTPLVNNQETYTMNTPSSSSVRGRKWASPILNRPCLPK